jgi:hypothetical protein
MGNLPALTTKRDYNQLASLKDTPGFQGPSQGRAYLLTLRSCIPNFVLLALAYLQSCRIYIGFKSWFTVIRQCRCWLFTPIFSTSDRGSRETCIPHNQQKTASASNIPARFCPGCHHERYEELVRAIANQLSNLVFPLFWKLGADHLS